METLASLVEPILVDAQPLAGLDQLELRGLVVQGKAQLEVSWAAPIRAARMHVGSEPIAAPGIGAEHGRIALESCVQAPHSNRDLEYPAAPSASTEATNGLYP